MIVQHGVKMLEVQYWVLWVWLFKPKRESGLIRWCDPDSNISVFLEGLNWAMSPVNIREKQRASQSSRLVTDLVSVAITKFCGVHQQSCFSFLITNIMVHSANFLLFNKLTPRYSRVFEILCPWNIPSGNFASMFYLLSTLGFVFNKKLWLWQQQQ